MNPVTLLAAGPWAAVHPTLAPLAASGLLERILLHLPPGDLPPEQGLSGVPVLALEGENPGSSRALARVLDRCPTPWLLQVLPGGRFDPHPHALSRLLDGARSSGASLTWSDYAVPTPDGQARLHPLADAQPGSVGDDFKLGPWALWRRERLTPGPDLTSHAWYHQRLQALPHGHLRIPEALGTWHPVDQRASGARVFDYLTTAREQQVAAEAVFTSWLDQQGARLRGPFRPFRSQAPFPVEASVVIPVRDRARTVMEAVQSALSQQAPFSFNVIVVDNHSTDGTTALLADRAARDPRLVHRVPERWDLGIGGCWNEAVFHDACGRYVVQLDSDDLYASPRTLATMVLAMRDQEAPLAVGSYTLVDFDLNPIPPGLIDHREWTEENGRNNLLRIGGMGAPRAWATQVLRQHPFPNASYGEDYAVVLAVGRTWKVARVWESVYLCRRWADNTDADLSPELAARHQVFKDRVRTLEIGARKLLNAASGEAP